MSFIIILFSSILASIGFRLRGGLFGQQIGWGTTTARFVAWALPMTAITFLTVSDYPWWMIIPTLLTWWLGCILPWWHSLDMGRMSDTLLRDIAMHSLRGMIWVLPSITLVGVIVGPNPVLAIPLLVSLLCGPSYVLGYYITEKISNRMGGTEYGEWIFGFLVGLSISASYLML